MHTTTLLNSQTLKLKLPNSNSTLKIRDKSTCTLRHYSTHGQSQPTNMPCQCTISTTATPPLPLPLPPRPLSFRYHYQIIKLSLLI